MLGKQNLSPCLKIVLGMNLLTFFFYVGHTVSWVGQNVGNDPSFPTARLMRCYIPFQGA